MLRPGWIIDELSNAGDEHLDSEYVATYDRKSAVDTADDLNELRESGLDEDSIVVDLGAGTGTFAVAVAAHCRKVIAADVSPAMLSIMEENVAEAGLTNVDIVRAGLLSYVHEGTAPDFVYSRNTLHHLPDFWKAVALTQIASMLAPGGVLLLHDLVYSFDPAETREVIEAWLERAAPTPEEGFTRMDLETHIREEYSTYSWLMEPMLERAGFEIREARYRPSRTFAAYLCVKR